MIKQHCIECVFVALIVLSVIVDVACKTKADIVFMLDSSFSVHPFNFEKEKKFLINLIDKMSIVEDQINVGVIVYSTVSSIAISLKQYTTKASLRRAIGRLRYQPGVTNTPAALMDAVQLLRIRGRPDVPKIGILLTGMISYRTIF